MANANTPFGFQAVRNAGNGADNGGLETFYVPATDGTALYIGDPVIKDGSADANGVARSPAPLRPGRLLASFRASSRTARPTQRLPRSLHRPMCSSAPTRTALRGPGGRVGGALAGCRRRPERRLHHGRGQCLQALGRDARHVDQGDDCHASAQDHGLLQKPDNAIGANAKVLVKLNSHRGRWPRRRIRKG
jgi:hypothetical protein